MASLLDAFISGGQAGRTAYENRHADERESALGKLAGQAHTAAPEERKGLLALMAPYSPEFANQQASVFRADEDRSRTRVAGAAKFMLEAYKSKDPARIQGAYQAVMPVLAEVGKASGKTPPPQWSDDMLPHVYQLAGENGGAVSDNPYSDLPSDIQSLRMLQENPELAKLDRERRQAAGMVPKMAETSQGIGSWKPGGEIVLSPIVDPRHQGNPVAPTDAAPVTQPGGQGSIDPASLQNDFRSIAQETGFEITSMERPVMPGVGAGVNSQHPNGTAADFRTIGKSRPQIDRLIGRLRQDPRFEVIDETDNRNGKGPHVHVELRPQYARGGGAQGPRPGMPQIAQPYVKPEAPSTPAGYERKPDGTMSYVVGGPADPMVMAQRPIDPAKAQKLEQAKRKETAMLSATEADIQDTIDLVDELINESGNFTGVTGMGSWGAKVPGSPWANTNAKLETLKARSAFGSLQEMRANSPTGGALGSVTERELALLQNAETQLQNTQSPEALKAALRKYRKALADSKQRMRQGVEEFYQQEAGPSPGAQQGGNPQIDSLLEKYR